MDGRGRRSVLAGAAGLALVGAARAVSAKSAGRPPPPDPRLWDPAGAPRREGFAPVPGGRVWWRLYGADRPGAPVITLHGGPSAESRYMWPYAALAEGPGARPVLVYDQLGCGRSDAPADPALYTPDRFVAEVEALRTHLGLRRAVVLGHSWGGWLAPRYAAAHPDAVAALVLCGTTATVADMQATADRYIAGQGPAAVRTVREALRSGRTDAPAFQAVLGRYYTEHLCRLDPWPKWFDEEGERVGRNRAYLLMNGPNEFTFTGTLRDFSNDAVLPRLRTPALVMVGEHDYAGPPAARRLAGLVAGAELEVLPGLSHMSHVEAPTVATGRVRRFLQEHRV